MVCILALGSNSGGQLATGDLEDVHHITPSRFVDSAAIDLDKSERWSVHGGGNHVFAWSSDGTRLFASGSNADGELATGNKGGPPALAWTPVEFPGDRVVQISCGWNHSVLLNDRGELFAAGSNGFGQLGTGSATDKDGCWRPVLAPKSAAGKTQACKFVAVSCGLRHSLAVAEDGRVYGWGANRSGQLGVANVDKKTPNVSHMVLVSDGLPPMASVACGRSHSMMLSRDRKTIFTAGMDKHGQCGPSDVQPVTGLWRAFASPKPVLKLCSGWEFGAVLLEQVEAKDGSSRRTGVVAAWGRADHGQLATGRRQNGSASYRRELVCVPGLDDVSDIVCGSNHTVALRASGEVSTWGWNEHGNAGDPALNDVCSPLRIASDNHSLTGPVLAIGCGYGNSYFVV
ncbi:alpha tubulin suppressor [Coemansia sp. IMI 203386]|nr:alpha tubulin suppressor [Coemansia sp. IMI 203386]